MQAVKIVLPVFPSQVWHQLIFVFHLLRRFYSVNKSCSIVFNYTWSRIT